MTLSCPVWKKCGGCDFAKVPYAEQLKRKQADMEALLGGFCHVEPILGMEDPYYYRGKVHRVLGLQKGKILSGCYEANSHRVVDIRECLIEDRRCQEVVAEVVRLIPSFKLKIYDEDAGRGFLRHILVRRGFATDEVMLVLVTADKMFPGKNNFVKAMHKACPDVTTIVQNVNPARTSMVLGKQNIVLSGPGFIKDKIGGLTFRISPSSFFQVNPVQTEVLYNTAMDFAGLTGKETVLDAYCGTGTIGMCAAQKAKQVIGVELNADAVRDAKQNAKENGITNIIFFADDAGKYMEKFAAGARTKAAPVSAEEQPPAAAGGMSSIDVLFMDPPRTGSTETFIRSAAKAAPSRVVYISCGPDTLARDLKLFVKLGYSVDRIQPVDMFPETRHVECVTLLEKSKVHKTGSITFDVEMDDYSRIVGDRKNSDKAAGK